MHTPCPPSSACSFPQWLQAMLFYTQLTLWRMCHSEGHGPFPTTAHSRLAQARWQVLLAGSLHSCSYCEGWKDKGLYRMLPCGQEQAVSTGLWTTELLRPPVPEVYIYKLFLRPGLQSSHSQHCLHQMFCSWPLSSEKALASFPSSKIRAASTP